MKVKAKIIGPYQPPKGFENQKEVPVDCPGNSLADLLQQISSRIDDETRGIFFTEERKIAPDLILVNGILIPHSGCFNFKLKEGDLIELIWDPGS